MKIKTLFFGVSRDVVGVSNKYFDIKDGMTIGEFQSFLTQIYRGFAEIKDYAIAANEDYVTEEYKIKDSDIIAIIPPVSGG